MTDRLPEEKPQPCQPLRRHLLILAGSLFVVLGGIGALVPILPTTPFLLLAATCYLRSSQRLYDWLMHNRLFGEYLRRYRAGQGLPLGLKIWTITVLWLSLSASALWGVPAGLWWVRLLLAVVGIGVSLHLILIKTWRPPALESLPDDTASPVNFRPGSNHPPGARYRLRPDKSPTESR